MLLIGDSILNGYGKQVTAALAGKAYVDLWVNPHCQSEHVNKLLAQVLENGPYDVVHFNMGLHGWQEGRIKEGTFEPLTKAYVQVIRDKLPAAKIIWASSTPVTVKAHEPVQITDWMPTYCSIIGYRPQQDLKWDGVDITAVLTKHESLPTRPLYAVAPGSREQKPKVSIRWKNHPWVQHLTNEKSLAEFKGMAPLPTSRGEAIIGSEMETTVLYQVPIGKGQLIYSGWSIAASLLHGRKPSTVEMEINFEMQAKVLGNILDSLPRKVD